MVGMSAFFSSTFQNIFTAQEQSSDEQEQFTMNEVIRGKLLNIDTMIDPEEPDDDSYLVFTNDTSAGRMPFTYIGKEDVSGDDYAVIKDFFVFNDVEIDAGSPTNYSYGNSGAGQIIDGSDTTNVPKNFAGFTKNIETSIDYYYITYPLDNKVIKCEKIPNPTCTDIITDLNKSIGVDSYQNTSLEDRLVIADSGNGKILITDTNGSILLEVEDNIDFPTGISHGGTEGGSDVIFFADSYENTVKKIVLDGTPEAKIIVGGGSNLECNNTAELCKLDFPTGVFVDKANNALYIANTGANNILKVEDPGIINTSTFPISYTIPSTYSGPIVLDHITFTFELNIDLSGSPEPNNQNGIHIGGYDFDNIAKTIDYRLYTTLNGLHEESCVGSPPTCTPYNTIDANDSLFELNDIIIIEQGTPQADAQQITDISSAPSYGITGSSISHNDGVRIDLENSYITLNPGDNFSFELDLSSSAINSFNKIDIEIYEQGNATPVISDVLIIRNGDGNIGSPEGASEISEDTIEVVLQDPDVNYPTGIAAIVGGMNNYVIFGNTGTSQKIQYDLNSSIPSNVAIEAYSKDDLIPYDYTSDFKLADFRFKSYDVGSGADNLLNLTIDAFINDSDSKAYTLSSSL